jgi:hypothetical protein
MWSKTVTDSDAEDELFNIFQSMHRRQANLLLLRLHLITTFVQRTCLPDRRRSRRRANYIMLRHLWGSSLPNSQSTSGFVCRLHKERRAPRPASPRICSFVLAPIVCSRAEPSS